MKKIKLLALLLVSVLSINLWATDYTNVQYTFGTTVPSGWTVNATTTAASGYLKLKSGETISTTAANLFGDEILCSKCSVEVSCGTFGTWKGTKSVTVTVDLLNNANAVLSTASSTFTSLTNGEGAYKDAIVVDKPSDPSKIATLRITYTIPNSADVLRAKYVRLNYSTEASAPSKTLSSIAVTTQPSKKNYTTCETLDLSGCVVTAYYSDANPEDVTKDCTFTPADGAALTTTSVTSVAVSYGGKETSINDIVVTKGASDTYVDNVHNSVISGDFSCSYSAPSIQDKSKGATESCEDTHYHFVGWVEEGTTPIQSPSNVIPAGTNMTGSNKTYKAVWAKEAE